MFRGALQGAALAALLLGLPLLGAFLAGHPLARYLEFPPLTRYVPHAAFSWPAFALTSIAGLLGAAFLLALFFPDHGRSARPPAYYAFPPWGWGALVSMLLFWILAWNRFRWFMPWQPFAFTGLWVSYIFLVNAITYRRSGACYITHRPRELIALFPASALFWWYFEYLNRFVQNWHYAGVEGFGPLRYSLHATLAFSTVLPSVISSAQLLETFPRLSHAPPCPRLAIRISRRSAWAFLVLSAAGLVGVAVWPDYLFFVVWVLPAFIVLSLQALCRQGSILSRLERGDWHEAGLFMLAALLCGFFWEMWNYRSDPKWIYSIPFVNRFHLFEMPLLGYLGYLPFGFECLLAAEQISRWVSASRNQGHFGKGDDASRISSVFRE